MNNLRQTYAGVLDEAATRLLSTRRHASLFERLDLVGEESGGLLRYRCYRCGQGSLLAFSDTPTLRCENRACATGGHWLDFLTSFIGMDELHGIQHLCGLAGVAFDRDQDQESRTRMAAERAATIERCAQTFHTLLTPQEAA